MANVRMIARLLDQNDCVLAWCEFSARMPGDGALWADGPVVAIGEADGIARTLLVHWPDMHAQRRISLEPSRVALATPVPIQFVAEVMRFDDPSVHPPLPPVTVRAPVALSPPSAAMGARDSRIVV